MEGFLHWLVVFARVGTLFGVLPVFSAQSIPVQVRLGLAGLSALLINPFVAAFPEPSTVFGLAGILFSEISVGLLLGFVSKLVFYAIEIAGTVLANELGLNLAGVMNPVASGSTPLPTQLLHLLTVVLFFCLDLHTWMIVGLQQSYQVLGPGAAVMQKQLLLHVLNQVANIFGLAVLFTGPVLAVSFVVNIIFSLLGRAIPQVNALSESFPVRTMTGLFVFGSTSVLLGREIANALGRIPQGFSHVIHLLAGA